MITSYAFRVCDLKDPPLRIIPEKDLDVVIRVSWVFRCDIASRFEDNKAPIAANAPCKRLGVRIGKLADNRIDLAPNGEAYRK